MCPKCGEEFPHDRNIYLNEVPVGNSNVYEFTCKQGHLCVMQVQNPRFEVIFESGILAIRDGYFREAVFDFAIALERFYQYSISYFLCRKVLGTAYDYLTDNLFDEYEAMWDAMSKQSERQIGAFYSLFFSEFDKPCPIFSSHWLKTCAGIELKVDNKKVDPIYFRNIVVHQGYTPTKEQALLYGEAVNKYMQSLLVKYWETDFFRIVGAMSLEMRLSLRDFKGGKPMGTTGIGTFVQAHSSHYVHNNPSLYDLFK
jgi:hypothetical protein